MPNLWNATRTELRRQLGDPNFARLFSTLRWDEAASEAVDASTLCLCTADEMAALMVEKNHRGLIEQCATSLSGRPVAVRLRLVDAPAAPVGTAFGATAFGAEGAASREQLSLFASPPVSSDVHVAPARAQVAQAAALDACSLAPPPAGLVRPRSYAEAVRASGVAPTSRFERFVVGKSNARARRVPGGLLRRSASSTTRSSCTAAWGSGRPTSCRPPASPRCRPTRPSA